MNNKNSIANYFELSKNNTSFSKEISAGLTTFMTMAYILAVNPDMLAQTGMDKGAVFTATALSAFIATFIMGVFAKLPFALAPGMGLNAFFTFYVVMGLGKSWQFALTAVFLEGIIFIILSLLKVREAIVNSLPLSIKRAISVGIGLFIALVGFSNAGLVTSKGGTIVSFAKLNNPAILITIFGLILIAILLSLKVKGALLIGIIGCTLIGIPFGVTKFSGTIFSMPPDVTPTLMKFEWTEIFSPEMFAVLITFLMVDMFDTVGTLVGVSTKAKILDDKGKIPNVNQALFADALGTTVGAVLGTSTVTTYVESASGVAEGGRTGLTAVSTSFFFLLSLFFAPLFLVIPAAATAPALIIVGAFMMSPIKDIDLEDFSELIPAFLTMIVMPFSYSISEGILYGVVSYILIKVLSGKHKDIPLLTYVIGLIFILTRVFEYMN